jgi:ferredoxin-NADP reductase
LSDWKVKFIEKIERCSNIKSFRFQRPNDLNYLPGQFYFIYLIKDDGSEIMHHFSFSSSPTEPMIEFTTRIRDSEFKKNLDQLPLGSVIKISSVSGKFSLTPKIDRVVFLCGGIGITAARSNIRWAIDTRSPTDIILLYGNRNSSTIAFKEELNAISSDNFKLFHILSDPEDSWNGPAGFINKDFILSSVPDFKERRWYISGPPVMVKSIKSILTNEINISLEKVIVENYVGY